MTTLDVDALLLEIDPAAPCGPDLEYDPAFVALEQEAAGKPEVQYGATITAAVPPDWKQVRRGASALMARSRDLRLATWLLRAELALGGIDGFAAGVSLIERLLAERWSSVHPQLDPDDGLDPTMRINSLAMLADPATVLRELKEAPLLVLRSLGPLSIRLLEIASGDMPAPAGHAAVSLASIEKAVADLEPALLAGVVDALARSLAAVVDIELQLVRAVGSSQALNLDALTRPLRKAHQFLAPLLPTVAEEAAVVAEAAAEALAPGGALAARPAVAASSAGDIASRDDVMRMLGKMLDYYKRHEPSSPVPLLLERARRLVPMGFAELMEDLAPGGLPQLAVIRGPQPGAG